MGTRTVRAREGWNPKQVPRTEVEMMVQGISQCFVCCLLRHLRWQQRQQRIPAGTLLCHSQFNTQHLLKHTRSSCNTTRVSPETDFLPPKSPNLFLQVQGHPHSAFHTLQTHAAPVQLHLQSAATPAPAALELPVCLLGSRAAPHLCTALPRTRQAPKLRLKSRNEGAAPKAQRREHGISASDPSAALLP